MASRAQLTASFLWMCPGYYRHDEGYTPDWPGMARFKGPIVHPQSWPESLDTSGKHVLVIGSGATAATMVPALAPKCGHVTVLQRSPSYYYAGTSDPPLAAELRSLGVEESLVLEIMRRRYLLDDEIYLKRSAEEPEVVAAELIADARKHLGPDYDVETHFTPKYWPWRQRLCLIPDGDFYTAIREGRASMATDEIETFTETGVLLKSGKNIDADIIVTATGLQLIPFGGIALEVDGAPVAASDTITFHGMMFTGLPNLAWVFGYIRATWTFRVDLVADFVCQMLNHMDAQRLKARRRGDPRGRARHATPSLAEARNIQPRLRHARPARAPQMRRQAEVGAQPRLLHRPRPVARRSRRRRGAGVRVSLPAKESDMPKPINFIELANLSADARQRLLTRTEADLGPFEEKVRPIIEAVRTEGDVALSRFARQFDKSPVEAACHRRDGCRFRRRRSRARSGRCVRRWPSRLNRSANSTRTRSPRRCGCTRFAPACSPAIARRPSPPSPATCRAARARSRVSR